MIRGIERKSVEELIRKRDFYGTFTAFEDFINRIRIPFDQLVLLIRVNAFREIDTNRKRLLWKTHVFYQKKPSPVQQQLGLDNRQQKPVTIPEIQEHPLELDFDYFELLGFPLCSPFKLLSVDLGLHFQAAAIPRYKNKIITIYGYLISLKNSKSASGQAIAFGMFSDRKGGIIDTVHFNLVLKRYPFSGNGIYMLKGRVVEEFDFYCIEVSYMKKQRYIEDPRFSEGTP
tara:strand:- start:233 stop:922 length:690 start_codon:yes stop_codon:yes gene_type:complete